MNLFALLALLMVSPPGQHKQAKKQTVPEFKPQTLKRIASGGETLTGLKGFGVSVYISTVLPDMQARMEGAGLSERVLKTAAELQMQKSGIRLGPVYTGDFNAPSPTLRISVNLMDSLERPELMAYSLTCDVAVNLDLPYRPGYQAWVTLWSTQSFGTVGKARVGEIRDAVLRDLDEFCNEYLKANPKP